MCGISGFYGNVSSPHQTLKKMLRAICHRGPDDNGIWFDEHAGIGLAHNRLAIIDLSSAGHQPMVSHSGKFIITFNGEIYNHLEIRTELNRNQFINWRGHSDTETLLMSIEIWGLGKALSKCVGMFAFALWNRELRELTLARDRLGEKPLYYGYQGNDFLFGSELKALREHPSFQGVVSRKALALQLRHNCIPAPNSIYVGIKKLEPGTFLKLSFSASYKKPPAIPQPTQYWSFEDSILSGDQTPFKGRDSEAVNALDSILRKSISQQMAADVPLGAFLSGGVDSSTIVALMQTQSLKRVKTFSIGFNEGHYNEATYAKAVAQHLGTDHEELYFSHKDVLDVIPKIPVLYDEPFSDSSQLPTFLLSQITRRHVSIALSGDGADELFGGYNRYILAGKLWKKISRLPNFSRRWASTALTSLSPDSWNKILGIFYDFTPSHWQLSDVGSKVHKGASVLSANNLDELYLGLISHWKHPPSIVIDGEEPDPLKKLDRPKLASLDGVKKMMALDTLSYLPDDILVKIDRAAMGVSLETRVPFLDHRIVEFAWTLPLSMKFRNGHGKWVLRQVLNRYVPNALIDRPKMGFGVPIDSWLRGPLRDWAENLLDKNRIESEGFFYPEPILKKWEEHLLGKRNWQHDLWDVLMFQAWLEKGNRLTKN